jgi:uncharacterized protein (TIRG00374 family)
VGTRVEASPVRRIVGRAVGLLVTALVLYVFAPTLVEFLAEAPRLLTIDPVWLLAMLGSQAASFVALWQLHHVAIRCDDRVLIATSQLAANAFSRVVPGGAAAAGALQYRMLVQGGVGPAAAATGLTAVGLITVAALLALPVLSVPAMLAGIPVPAGLWEAALVGLVAFVVLFAIAAFAMNHDGVLRAAARVVAAIRARLGRTPPPGDPAAHLIEQRDAVRASLGRGWRTALAAAVGNRLLDYLALLFALRAVGAAPDPSLVLLAYVAAAVLGMIPLTPGGLGFVEAGLVATLGLAGVAAPDAVLAALAYRLVSYWLPLPAGAVAYTVHRRRLAAGAFG